MTARIAPFALVAALALTAPAAASAASNPYRTETQAVNYMMKRIDSGTGQCYGDRGRPNAGTYQRFYCILQDWDAHTATAYRLDTRPSGAWRVRVLR